MKQGTLVLFALAGLGVTLAGGCAGDTPDDLANGPKQAKAGHSGTGGTGGSQTDDIPPASGGSAGRSPSSEGGETAGHAGTGGSKSRGHGGGGGTRAASAGEAGSGGEPDQAACHSATTGPWLDVTEPALIGMVGEYAAVVQGSEFAGMDARIELTVRNPDTGVFELGSGDDANLKSCQHCLTLQVSASNGGASRLYFADEGTLVIDGESETLQGALAASLAGVRFVEVTVDGSGKSSPVAGSACVAVASSHVAVGLGSSGGAGGAGGEGGESGMGGMGGMGGEGGALDGYPVPDNCIEVTTGPPWTLSQNESFTGYGSVMQPNLGSPESDPIALGFYADDTGTFKLGAGPNATWESCTQCILARIPDATVAGKLFFGAAGTIEVASGGLGPMSGTINATLTDISLIEMTSDLSAPIENGVCLHLQSAMVQFPE